MHKFGFNLLNTLHCSRDFNANVIFVRCFSVVKPHKVFPIRKFPDDIEAPAYVKSLANYESSIQNDFFKRKTSDEIERMRTVCKIAREILDLVGGLVKPGVTTDHLDGFVNSLCIERKVYPSPLLYRGFPKSICTSVNNVVCHGIPDNRPLENGDVVNIDITIYKNGYHGDVSHTYPVGSVDKNGLHLIDVTKMCRDEAAAICRPGLPFSAIGNKIESLAKRNGFQVIPDICGHGIGSYFHGPPDIVHASNDFEGIMEEGMTFTIEPVLTEGGTDINVLEDKWTVVTCDNSRTAQFEHTILITESGSEILT